MMDAMTTLSGLDYMRAIASGEIEQPPMARLLGFGVVEVEEGRAVFTAEPGEQHYNPIGVVHGGLAATLLDSAMGCAVHTTLGRAGATARSTFGALRPPDHERHRPDPGEGVVVHRGSKTATTEGRVWAEDSGKLLAHGTGSALLLPVAVAE